MYTISADQIPRGFQLGSEQHVVSICSPTCAENRLFALVRHELEHPGLSFKGKTLTLKHSLTPPSQCSRSPSAHYCYSRRHSRPPCCLSTFRKSFLPSHASNASPPHKRSCRAFLTCAPLAHDTSRLHGFLDPRQDRPSQGCTRAEHRTAPVCHLDCTCPEAAAPSYLSA